jgi:hypothetical protein
MATATVESWISKSQAARLLDVDARTFEKLLAAGRLKTRQLLPSSRLTVAMSSVLKLKREMGDQGR